jgi:hypothetical protein
MASYREAVNATQKSPHFREEHFRAQDRQDSAHPPHDRQASETNPVRSDRYSRNPTSPYPPLISDNAICPTTNGAFQEPTCHLTVERYLYREREHLCAMRRRHAVACLQVLEHPEWEFKHQRFSCPTPHAPPQSSIDHGHLGLTSTPNLSTTLRAGNTVLRAKHPRRSATARFDDTSSGS